MTEQAMTGSAGGFEARWISAETERKEQDFRGLLHIHIPVCRSILGRLRDPLPYLFMDLHGGPGNLRYGAQTFPGSPLIALQELARAQLPHQTVHFERDRAAATYLADAVTGYEEALVSWMPFEQGVPLWLKATQPQPWRYGLVYSDPIKDPIPVDIFNLIAKALPKVDLLAYVSATNQYKRANANGQGHGRRLADDIAAVHKRYKLIRQPQRAEHYTFILWSNWDHLPDWRKRGFHRLDTPAGQEILEVLDCTERERHERRNTPLPFSPTEPTPSTSAILASWPSEPRSLSAPVGSANGAASDPQPNRTTSSTRPGAPSTSRRTWSLSAIPATAEPTGRSGEDG